jgi:precorrin-3B C17-methyltransferase
MGKLYVVGLGPGGAEYMTEEARAALARADVLVGYTVYLDLVRDMFPDKEIFTTPMRQEIERCRRALEIASGGKTVAMLSSGDAGVYGMAGLILEMSGEFPEVEIEVVAGVTAALSGAAVLGAPLMHDFCVISLSDLLTPWETIERRLRCAAEGDFAVCIYNPCSKKRRDHLRRACDILLDVKSPDTVSGWVRNIGREGQEMKILTLGELRDEELDMFTTVFVGSSKTRRIGGRMVTPRGYENKEQY